MADHERQGNPAGAVPTSGTSTHDTPAVGAKERSGHVATDTGVDSVGAREGLTRTAPTPGGGATGSMVGGPLGAPHSATMPGATGGPPGDLLTGGDGHTGDLTGGTTGGGTVPVGGSGDLTGGSIDGGATGELTGRSIEGSPRGGTTGSTSARDAGLGKS